MVKRLFLVSVFVMLSLCFISCERTNTTIDLEGLADIQSIPAEYGDLESVTSEARYPGWSQLWFSDSTGVIRMVRVNWEMNKMIDDVLIIDRTSAVE